MSEKEIGRTIDVLRILEDASGEVSIDGRPDADIVHTVEVTEYLQEGYSEVGQRSNGCLILQHPRRLDELVCEVNLS